MSMYEHINGVTKATYDSSVWSNSSVTCGDCIYFTTEHPELTEYRKCEKQTTDEYQAYVVADKKVCKDFEESWESESE